MSEEALPPELLAAITQFVHWSTQQLEAEQAATRITTPLYHYTNATGLRGIIESQKFWFTGYRHLNDPSELTHGMDIAHRLLVTIAEQHCDGLVKIFCEMVDDLFKHGNFAGEPGRSLHSGFRRPAPAPSRVPGRSGCHDCRVRRSWPLANGWQVLVPHARSCLTGRRALAIGTPACHSAFRTPVTFQEAMSEAVPKRMTEAEFLAWQSGRDQRYELVDGVPQAMTGARIRHDIARGNADRHLAPQLRAAGKGCRPFSADIDIRVYPGQLRRPELSVLCPPFDMEDMVSETPRLVLEVLSDTTRRIDEHVKVDEYKGIAALDYIILMSPTEPDVAVWSRDEARQWQRKRYQSVDDVIPLPLLEASLPLAILYDGIDLRPAFSRAVES